MHFIGFSVGIVYWSGHGFTRTAQRTVDAIEQMVTQDTKATMARRVTELMWGALLGTPTNAGVADDDVAALLIDALASGAQRYDNAISATELAGAEAATHRAQLIDRAIGAIAEPRVAGRALKLLSALLNVYPAASKSGSFGELPTIGPAPPPSPSAGTSRSTKLAELEGRLGLTELVVKLACKAASAGSELLVTLLDLQGADSPLRMAARLAVFRPGSARERSSLESAAARPARGGTES